MVKENKNSWDLSPIDIISKEISNSENLISEDQVRDSINRLLKRAFNSALSELEKDPHSEESLNRSYEYLALSTCVVCFGTTLKFLEDIEND